MGCPRSFAFIRGSLLLLLCVDCSAVLGALVVRHQVAESLRR